MKKSKASVAGSKANKAKEEIKALLKAINAMGMCENNWGQPGPKRHKWIFLHVAHMTKNSRVELPRLGPWARIDSANQMVQPGAAESTTPGFRIIQTMEGN